MDPFDHLKPVQGCPMDWKGMTGDQQARHCSKCQKTVHNISELTRSQTRALFAEKGRELCVAFFATPDGRLISRPETTWYSRCVTWLRGSTAFATGLVLAGCATPSTSSVPPAPVSACEANKTASASTTPPGDLILGDVGINFTELHNLPPEKQGTKR